MSGQFIDVGSLDYSTRQLIVVADHEVVAAARGAEARARESRTNPGWSDIAEAVLKAVAPLSVQLVEVASDALKAWAIARQSGLNILQISRAEAEALVFPPGHPRDGVLYIGHPAAHATYCTASSFHRLAFEHKFSEAIDILMHLGATTLKVEHLRGWSREFAAQLAVPFSQAPVRAHADVKSAAAAGLLYEATLRGCSEPRLPESLVWYPHEPTWQVMAQGRLHFGLSDFSLIVNYDDDFGVDARLGMGAGKSGLELGGKFEGHENTTWRLVGKFAGG